MCHGNLLYMSHSFFLAVGALEAGGEVQVDYTSSLDHVEDKLKDAIEKSTESR